jgi:hypothetical protein
MSDQTHLRDPRWDDEQTALGDHDDDETSERLTCPECGEHLEVDEEWRITDRSLIGTEIGDDGIQGDYAHERCLHADSDREDKEPPEGANDL